ncbi:hypothetical protein [Geopseudomonas aromaticivorans]
MSEHNEIDETTQELMGDPQAVAEFQARLTAFAAQLQAQGIHSVEVKYYGSSDEMNGFTAHYFNADDQGLDIAPEDLEDELGELMDTAIELSGHDQFWEGNGGTGTFTVSASGEAKIEHSHYEMNEKTTDYAYRLGVAGDEAGQLPGSEDLEAAGGVSAWRIKSTMPRHAAQDLATALAEGLRESGFSKAYMQYTGAGDEGHTETFRIDDLDGTQTDEIADKLPEIKGYEGFYEALEALMDHCVDANQHFDWEEGDGGCGSITLTNDGGIAFSHSYYVEEASEPHVVVWPFEAPAPAADYQPEPSM